MNDHKEIEKKLNAMLEAGFWPDCNSCAKYLKEYIDAKFEDLYDRLEMTLILHDMSTTYIPTND